MNHISQSGVPMEVSGPDKCQVRAICRNAVSPLLNLGTEKSWFGPLVSIPTILNAKRYEDILDNIALPAISQILGSDCMYST